MIDLVNQLINGILTIIPTILMVLSGYSIGTILALTQATYSFSTLRKLIYGNIILCFIFATGFIIFGILQHEVKFFFTLFMYLIVLLSLIGVYFLVRTKIDGSLSRYSITKIKNNIFILFGIALFLCIVTYYAIIIYYHPIFSEYDSIYLFLPTAKSILLGNGLHHDFFIGSDIAIMTPPFTQAINAWLMNSLGYQSLRFFPFYYVCFASIIIYAFTQSITRDKDRFTCLLASCLFLLMPALLVVSSRFSLQQDLPFLLFLTSSFYFLSLIVQQEKVGGKEVSLLVISLSLMMMTREIGVALAIAIFFLMPAIKFTNENMKLKVIFSILIFLPLYVLSAFDIIQYGLTAVVILRIATILVSTCILSYILTKVKNQIRFTEIKQYYKYLAFFIIPLIFIIANILTFSGPYPSLIFSRNYNNAMVFYRQVFDISSPVYLPLIDAINQLPRIDILIISVIMGSIFIFLKFRGLGRVFYQIGNSNYALLLALFIVMLAIWSYLLGSSYETSDIRHILYLAPLVTVIIIEGFSKGNESYLRIYKYAVIVLASYTFISIDLYVWNYNNHFGGFWIDPNKDILMNFGDLRIAIALVAVMIIVEIERDKLSRYFKDRSLKKYTVVGLSALLLMQIYILVNSGILIAPLYATDQKPPGNWENDVFKVVQYLKEAEPGNIFSIRAPAIAFFTNRTNFDVYNPQAFASIQFLLSSENSQDLITKLHSKNIRYLVIPNANNTWYYLVQNLSKKSNLLKLVDGDDNFAKITLGSFDLYKITSFSKKLNLLSIKNTWKPFSVQILRNDSNGLMVYSNSSNKEKTYHRAYLDTQLGLERRPSLLSIDYMSSSNINETKFLIEFLQSDNSINYTAKDILWNTALQNSNGKMIHNTFLLPSSIDNKRIEIRLYTVTEGTGAASLILKGCYLSYT